MPQSQNLATVVPNTYANNTFELYTFANNTIQFIKGIGCTRWEFTRKAFMQWLKWLNQKKIYNGHSTRQTYDVFPYGTHPLIYTQRMLRVDHHYQQLFALREFCTLLLTRDFAFFKGFLFSLRTYISVGLFERVKVH